MPSKGSLRSDVAASRDDATPDAATTEDADPSGGRATAPDDGGGGEGRRTADGTRSSASVDGRPLFSRRTTWLVLTVTALPFLVSAIAVFAGVGGTYRPYADVAQTELIVRDVGRYEVLVGPYSREGWHHPGPALYYLLAIPYRLLGSSSAAMSFGALVVNGGSIVGMGAIAKRRGGTALMLCMLVTLALMVRSLGFEFLAMAWNPYITALPYGFLVMLVWAMACGERWALPVGVVVATFVVQTHVGYVALALPLLGLGAAWLVADTLWRARRLRTAASADAPADATADATRRDTEAASTDAPAPHDVGAASVPAAGPDAASTPDPGTPSADPASAGHAGARPASDGGPAGLTGGAGSGGLRRWARRGWWGTAVGRLAAAGALAGVLGAVGWALPVLDQLRPGRGNMSLIAGWFRDHEGEARTLTAGWRVVSAQYALSAEWLVGWADRNMVEEPVYVDEPLVPLLLLVVAGAVVLGWRRLGTDARKLVAVWAVASAIGVVATARTIGALYAYRLAWTWTLGAIAGAYVLWVAWTFAAARWPLAERRVLVPVAVAAVATLAVVDGVVAAQAGTPEQEVSASLADLRSQAHNVLPEGDGEVVVSPTSFLTLGYAVGLADQLEADGIDIGFQLGGRLSAHRAPGGAPLRAELVMAADGDIVTQLEARPELEVVAEVGDLSFEELEAELAERAEIEARVMAEGPNALADPSPQMARDIERLGELSPPGSLIALLMAAPGATAPTPAPSA